MTSELERGIENCVFDCADVRPGQSVYVVSEEGAADEAVIEAIATVSRDRGADVQVIWGPEIPRERREEIPSDVLESYAKADVLFAHYPTLKREVLHPHFPGERRVRIPNRARTVDLMTSEWAGFSYSVQRTAAKTIDSLSRPGGKWRITSPGGTDVRGTFGNPESTVAQAYFVVEEDGRARRNFPGGVHSPAIAVAAEGVIVADHVAKFGSMNASDPLELELKEGRVVSVKGGDDEGRMCEAINSTDGFVESWHAGVNPKTVVPVARTDNPVEWYTYSHCSPMIVHFHIGRSHDPVDVACFHQTITVNDYRLYDRGQLSIWDYPDVDRAIRNSNMPSAMFETSAIPLV
ncbi:hypothetical protein OAJ57_00645 [Alphaproteobacteria bacterium]|nr:hypothetical protein [Alphaproteobacteria bacterium]